jgi:hypothetical protein
MQYQVCIRQQRSRGSSANTFGGPDTYVAVTAAPDGVEVPYTLNTDVLKKRGIKLIHFGEGYSKHWGPRSALGRAFQAAHDYVEAQTAKEKAPDEIEVSAASHAYHQFTQ